MSEMWSSSYANPGTSYAEAGGDLVITLAANSPSAYAGYGSYRMYDLRESRISAQISQLPALGASIGVAVELVPKTYVHVSVKNNMIIGAYSVNGTFMQVAPIPAFNFAATPYIAISETAGVVSFETSPDGVTWSAFATTPDPFDLSLVHAQMFAGTDTSIAAPGQAKFAAFNGAGTGAGGCPMTTLADSFSVDDPLLWQNSFAATCCSTSIAGGVLTVVSDGTKGFAGLRTSAGYDAREGRVSVAMPSPPSTGSVYAAFVLYKDSQNEVEIQIGATQMYTRFLVAGSPTMSAAIPRTTDEKYFQLRETGGTTYFEASTDRASWQPLGSVPDPFVLDDVLVTVQGGYAGTTATMADQIVYDDLSGQ
jgi:hypothetical protein